MVWQEIYFNRILTKFELKEALARAFNLEKDDIIVTSDLSILDTSIFIYKMLCQTYLLSESEIFRLRVNISCDDELEPKNDIKVYASLIESLNCKMLIDNYSSIPDTMLVIDSFEINEDSFDEAIEFELE